VGAEGGADHVIRNISLEFLLLDWDRVTKNEVGSFPIEAATFQAGISDGIFDGISRCDGKKNHSLPTIAHLEKSLTFFTSTLTPPTDAAKRNGQKEGGE